MDMADGYNGEITLSVDMDTKQVTQTANKLSKSLQNLFNTKGADTQSAQFQRWQAQVDKVLTRSTQLTQRLKELETQKIPTDEYIGLQKDIEKAEHALERLLTRREAYEEMGKHVPDKLANEIIHANEQLERLEQGMEELVKTGKDFKLGSDTAEYEKVSQQLNETNNKMVLLEAQGNKLTESSQSNTSAMAQGFSQIGTVISSLKPVLNFLMQRAKITFNIFVDGVKNVISKINELRKAVGEGIGNALTTIKDKAQNAFSNIGSFLKNLVAKHTEGTNSMEFDWGKLIKKVLAYGFGIRSLYILFRKLRSAITEGIQNMAQMNGGANEVNNSMTMLTSAVLQCKNALASMAAPILNIVAPALTYLINLITKVVTTIGMFIAALTGKSTFIKAAKVTKNYAASLGGLEKATKKATKAKKEEEKANKGVLQSYDELNNISKEAIEKAEGKDTTPDTGGAGGAGGAGGLSPDDMFEEVGIPDWIKDWVEKFKEWWDKADFSELGYILGTKLRDALNMIPWDMIQETAWKLGKSLATLMNGFISVPDLPETIGRTIGEAINTGIIFANAFLDYGNFRNLGTFIGAMIDSAIKTIRWEDLGHMFAQYLNALFQVIGFAADRIDWEYDAVRITEGINQFINDVNWDENGRLLGELVTGMIMGIQTAIANVHWAELGQGLGEFVMSLINSVPWDALGATFAIAFNSVFDGIQGFLDRFNPADLGSKLASIINTFISSAQWDENGAILGQFLTEMFSIFNTFFDDMDFEGLAQGITTFLNNAMENLDIDTIFGTITNAINGLITSVKTFVTENVLADGPQGFNFKLLGEKIYTAINKLIHDIKWDELGAALGGLFKGVIDVLWEVVTKTDWAGLAENLATTLNEWISRIEWDKTGLVLSEGINKAFEALGEFVKTFEWAEFKDNIVTGINTAINNLDMNSIMIALTEFCDKVLTTLKDIVRDIQWEELGEKVGSSLAESNFLDTVLEDAKELNDALMESIVSFAVSALGSYIESKAQDFRDKAVEMLEKFIEGADQFIPNLEEACQRNICEPVVKAFDDFFGTGNGSSDIMESKGNDVVEGFSRGFDNISNILDKIRQFKDDFFGVVQELHNDVVAKFEEMGNNVQNAWDNMWNGIRRALNDILDGIENFVNKAIDGINEFTSALNSLGNIDLPGGGKIGFSIGKIHHVSIPGLAEGAVIPPNKEFLAMLGDQKSGMNIETPLETMVDAFYQAIERAGLNDRDRNDNQDIIIQIDGYEIARATRKQDRIFKQSTGHSMFAY